MARVSVPLWGSSLSAPLPVIALVGHYPTNKLIGRRPILRRAVMPFLLQSRTYAVLPPISRDYTPPEGRFLRVTHPSAMYHPKVNIRLACLKHAASVHPELGSNSQEKLPSDSSLSTEVFGILLKKSRISYHTLIVKVLFEPKSPAKRGCYPLKLGENFLAHSWSDNNKINFRCQ